jgi:hypothetical protein
MTTVSWKAQVEKGFPRLEEEALQRMETRMHA